MNNVKKVLLVVSLLAVMTGCGSSKSSGTGALDTTQTGAVTSAIGTTVGTALIAAYQTRAKLAIPRAVTSADWSGALDSTSVPCAAGGKATVSGSASGTAAVDTSTVNVTYNYSFDMSFNGCMTTGTDAKTYTIDGPLSASGKGTTGITTGETPTSDSSFDSSLTGTLAVSGGGADVSGCEFNLSQTTTAKGSGSSYTGTANWDGTVCGASSTGSYSY